MNGIWHCLKILSLISFFIALPSLLIILPQRDNLQEELCLLVNKSFISYQYTSKCSQPPNYLFTYTVLLQEKKHLGLKTICSAVRNDCDGVQLNGPSRCHDMTGDSLEGFNALTINDNYRCFLNKFNQNIYLDDPRSPLYQTYVTGIAFSVICFASFCALICGLCTKYLQEFSKRNSTIFHSEY